MALIGYIEQLHCVGLKNRFLQRQIVTFQDNMSTKEEDNFSRSFRNAVHHSLSLGHIQDEDPDDFFACGLLEDGELLWSRFTRGP